jgi:hypothetical protein
MKNYHSIIRILCLACLPLIVTGCSTQPVEGTAPPANSAHVLVYRSPTFGNNLGLVVSVDGKDVGTFLKGHNYSGYLPAGQHVLGVRVNRPASHSVEKTLTVNSGQTYSFVAGYSSGGMTLASKR